MTHVNNFSNAPETCCEFRSLCMASTTFSYLSISDTPSALITTLPKCINRLLYRHPNGPDSGVREEKTGWVGGCVRSSRFSLQCAFVDMDQTEWLLILDSLHAQS